MREVAEYRDPEKTDDKAGFLYLWYAIHIEECEVDHYVLDKAPDAHNTKIWIDVMIIIWHILISRVPRLCDWLVLRSVTTPITFLNEAIVEESYYEGPPESKQK